MRGADVGPMQTGGCTLRGAHNRSRQSRQEARGEVSAPSPHPRSLPTVISSSVQTQLLQGKESNPP